MAPGAARTPAAPLDGAIAAACPVLHKPAAGERSGSPWARSDRSRSVARSGYRGLILCLHAQGEDAEALRVYDLCRRMLAAALGARPSAATGAIRCIIAAAAGDVSAGGSVDA